jgi:Arc/MetJ-type ribon-helix-helix transcriptional regulator
MVDSLTSAIDNPHTIHTDGYWMVSMADNVVNLHRPPADTEKITINLGHVDLGHIDVMVQERFYSNRTDFIRTAIRNQLERHADVIKQTVARKSLELGLRHYSGEELERLRAAGQMLHIQVVGLASIDENVTAELARATIASVVVLGAFHASPAVKAALADRMGDPVGDSRRGARVSPFHRPAMKALGVTPFSPPGPCNEALKEIDRSEGCFEHDQQTAT